MLIWTILSSSLDLDGFRGGWRISAVASQQLLAVMIVMGILLAAGYLLRIYVSRLALAYFGLSTLVGLILIRMTARLILQARYRAGAVRRIVIVGSGPVAQEAASKIALHPETLCKVVGFLATQDASLELLASETSTITNVSTSNMLDFLRTRQVDELVFAMTRNGNGRVAEFIDQCMKAEIAVSVVPQPYDLYVSKPELFDLGGLPILRLRHPLRLAANPAWKRMLDLFLAIAVLGPVVPVVFGAALLLKLKKGSAFCREERYGLHGKTFQLYRLNSPRNARNLPRYELIMQHLSVTELPQLWNVLRGDMSLVGPRPEGFESVRHYTDWHRQRFNVKPGMTGLAQVHGMRDQNRLEDKTRYDLQYILRRSLFQDVSLLLQTFWTLTGRLAHLGKLKDEISESPSAQPASHSLPA